MGPVQELDDLLDNRVGDGSPKDLEMVRYHLALLLLRWRDLVALPAGSP